MKFKYVVIAVILLVTPITAALVYASSGTLDSPELPTNTQSYTLSDIYNRLANGTEGAKTTFTEPSAGPGIGTGYTLDELMAVAPVADNTNGATPDQVVASTTYWGLRTDGTWGLQTGTLTVSGGSASLPKTGQTGCWDNGGNSISCAGTGQDGEYQKGVAWPNPRFTDNSDGTITDNLTNLVWLKDANCKGGDENFATALAFANALYDGWTGDGNGGDCGLSDGSQQGDWRLPNIRELYSLVDVSQSYPALPTGHSFINIRLGGQDRYASSTTYVINKDYILFIRIMDVFWFSANWSKSRLN